MGDYGQVPVNMDTLLQIEASPKRFRLKYLDWDPTKDEFLNTLENIFSDYINEAEKNTNSYEYVVSAMNRWYTNANNIGHIYYFIIIPIAAILYIAYMIFRLKGDRQRKKEWLEKNPNASKIYIGTKNAMLKTVIGAGGITVISIDGEKPIFFTEGLRTGFYASLDRKSVV